MVQSKLQHWFDEVWNNGNERMIDELMHENAEIDGLQTESDKRGPEAFKPFYQGFRQGFPSVKITTDTIYANEEIEVAKCFVRATSSDGKKVNFTGLSVAKFEDGKLVKAWNAFDFETMNKQLANPAADEFAQPQ